MTGLKGKFRLRLGSRAGEWLPLLVWMAGWSVLGDGWRNPVMRGADPHALVCGQTVWVYPTWSRGGLEEAPVRRRQDRLLELNKRLNSREKELEETQLSLEEHVQERTHEMRVATEQAEKRASRLQAIAEISHSIALTQNINELLPLITRAISQRLGFYHTGIFMLDEAREYAIELITALDSAGLKIYPPRQLAYS